MLRTFATLCFERHTEVDFTPDQQALVSDAIAAGRLHHLQEAIQQALSMWEERERRRLEILASLSGPKLL